MNDCLEPAFPAGLAELAAAAAGLAELAGVAAKATGLAKLASLTVPTKAAKSRSVEHWYRRWGRKIEYRYGSWGRGRWRGVEHCCRGGGGAGREDLGHGAWGWENIGALEDVG